MVTDLRWGTGVGLGGIVHGHSDDILGSEDEHLSVPPGTHPGRTGTGSRHIRTIPVYSPSDVSGDSDPFSLPGPGVGFLVRFDTGPGDRHPVHCQDSERRQNVAGRTGRV